VLTSSDIDEGVLADNVAPVLKERHASRVD
jgi:hypothetical protein